MQIVLCCYNFQGEGGKFLATRYVQARVRIGTGGGGVGGKKCLFFGKFDVIYFLIPVDTRLRFNVYKTSSDIKKVNNFYWLFTFAKTIIIDVLQGLNPLLPNVPS